MSNNDTRAELFAALEELSQLVPEMRAGQLMAAVGELCADLHGRGCGMPTMTNSWRLCGSSAEILRPQWSVPLGS